MDDAIWLDALIWPEHKERRKLFKQASKCLLHNRAAVDLINGDGIELLGDVSKEIPNDSVICIFHTHAANQMTTEMKNSLLDNIKRIGAKRDVFHIYNNV